MRTTATLNVSHCRFLVLDEADRLMDLGFERDISMFACGGESRYVGVVVVFMEIHETKCLERETKIKSDITAVLRNIRLASEYCTQSMT